MVQVFSSIAHLPKEITSYDLLKTFAIITMVIDHLGYFFFPENMTLRLIGRTSAPVWFFLIGYAMNRNLEPRLWIWASILAVGYFLMDQYTLPLNILFTMLAVRAVLNPIMKPCRNSFAFMMLLFFIFTLLSVFTYIFLEYGTLGFIFAALGYLARPENQTSLNKGHFIALAGVGAVFYGLIQTMLFGFTQDQMIVLIIMLAVLAMGLVHFKQQVYPRLTQKAGPAKYILFLTGRYTMEIYVLHLLLFKALALYVFQMEL
jgi:hypothetical protein